jgi:hypothetical protein
MKVTLLLADAAQAADGKLYILGGGWSITGPQPSPSALAIKIEVPWSETNRPHRWEARLENEDGGIVTVQAAEGPTRMTIDGEFEVGRPPGMVEGTPIDLPLAVNIGPIPLEPGRYVWRLAIDGETTEDWSAAFTVRSAPPDGR